MEALREWQLLLTLTSKKARFLLPEGVEPLFLSMMSVCKCTLLPSLFPYPSFSMFHQPKNTQQQDKGKKKGVGRGNYNGNPLWTPFCNQVSAGSAPGQPIFPLAVGYPTLQKRAVIVLCTGA